MTTPSGSASPERTGKIMLHPAFEALIAQGPSNISPSHPKDLGRWGDIEVAMAYLREQYPEDELTVEDSLKEAYGVEITFEVHSEREFKGPIDSTHDLKGQIILDIHGLHKQIDYKREWHGRRLLWDFKPINIKQNWQQARRIGFRFYSGAADKGAGYKDRLQWWEKLRQEKKDKSEEAERRGGPSKLYSLGREYRVSARRAGQIARVFQHHLGAF